MFTNRISVLVEATDAELDARIRELEMQRRNVEAELAATITVAEGRGMHLADGHRSMKGYLRAACNWSNGEIGRFRSASRLLDHHPPVGDAWLNGRIGSAQVAELSRAHGNRRAADRLRDFIPVLVDDAETLPYDDFRVAVRHFVSLADADGTHDDRSAIEGRTALVTEVGGALDVRASGGDRLATAEFLAIFDKFVEAEFHRDQQRQRDRDCDGDCDGELPPRRTLRQRRFDALLAMARAAAAHDGQVTRSEPLVSILCDQRTWSAVLAQSGLGATSSLDGETIDPFTGLAHPTDALDDLLGDPTLFMSGAA